MKNTDTYVATIKCYVFMYSFIIIIFTYISVQYIYRYVHMYISKITVM